jgi:putative nucleotidyltransferase with HDIG domain
VALKKPTRAELEKENARLRLELAHARIQTGTLENQRDLQIETSTRAIAIATQRGEAVDELYTRLREQDGAFEDASMDAIYALVDAIEARDRETAGHVARVENTTRIICCHLGMDIMEATTIGRASVLHDVGKIHTPDRILEKLGALSEAERLEMQRHTVIGAELLSKRKICARASLIARWHHENWDGSGYPDKLSGAGILLDARVVHLADVYDALATDRPYKKAWSRPEIIDYIGKQSGKEFDPRIASIFLEMLASGTFDEELAKPIFVRPSMKLLMQEPQLSASPIIHG